MTPVDWVVITAIKLNQGVKTQQLIRSLAIAEDY